MMNLLRNGAIMCLLLAMVALPLLLAYSCSSVYTGRSVAGRVRDIDTGQPIAGAIVVVLWVGSVVDSHAVCFHVETTVSDQDGRYRVPRWWQAPRAWLLTSSASIAQAYQRGYQDVWSYTEDAKAHPDDVYMKRFSGSDAERLEYIDQSVFGGMSCSNAEANRRNLFPLQSAVIQEAKGLAHSKEQQQLVEGMRQGAAYNWLAPIERSVTPIGKPLDRLPADIQKELE